MGVKPGAKRTIFRLGNTRRPARFPAAGQQTVFGSTRHQLTGPRADRIRKAKDTVMDQQTKPKILIVEDDPDLRTILRMQLDSCGFDVTEAPDGAAGFEQVQREKPDVIILDLMMPVLDGFGFLKRVRSIRGFQSVPVLILTASEDERHRIRGSLYEADDYMTKPYDLDELTEKVASLCPFIPADG